MLCSRYDMYSMKPRKGSKRTTVSETIEYTNSRGKQVSKTQKITYYNREDYIPVDNINDCEGRDGGIAFGTHDAYIVIPTHRLDDFITKFGDDNLVELINKNLTR